MSRSSSWCATPGWRDHLHPAGDQRDDGTRGGDQQVVDRCRTGDGTADERAVGEAAHVVPVQSVHVEAARIGLVVWVVVLIVLGVAVADRFAVGAGSGRCTRSR